MASATYRPSRNNLNNHITISETFHPKSHSFPQVSLAKRYDSLSLSSLSLLSSRFETAIVITKFWPYQSQKSYRDRNYSHIFSQLSTITKDIAQSRPQLQFKTLSGIINTNNTPGVSVANNTTTTTTSLYNFWREVQGCNNWDTLLNPLHPLLRQEIIRYGEFVTGSYKAFDLDPNSKRYLNCKYGKKRMLKEVGMENSGYEVTKYIYATPDINIPIQNSSSSSNSGRWIGYVAVASDEATKRLGRRDILITFRGTITYQEWIANFMSSLTPAMLDPHNPRPNVKVESGFLSLYTSDESSSNKFGLESCREQLLSEVSRLLNKYKGESEKLSISLAGHSMGSALALLLAYDIAELGLNKNIRDSIPVICMEKNLSGEIKPISMIPTSQKGLVPDYRLEDTLHAHQKNNEIPITVFSFGGPRVGNLDFKTRCEELGVKVLRIANVNDPITKLPGVLFNENFRVFGGRYEFPWSCSCYAHVGVELMLDFFNVQNPSCVHDLESYIGLLRSPSVEAAQPQREGINNFMEKVRELLLSSHNIKNLQGVFAGSDYYHGLLNSFPRDMLCSCGDELLFGLVLLLL